MKVPVGDSNDDVAPEDLLLRDIPIHYPQGFDDGCFANCFTSAVQSCGLEDAAPKLPWKLKRRFKLLQNLRSLKDAGNTWCQHLRAWARW